MNLDDSNASPQYGRAKGPSTVAGASPVRRASPRRNLLRCAFAAAADGGVSVGRYFTPLFFAFFPPPRVPTRASASSAARVSVFNTLIRA